ncbi:hypothetical protein [Borrelia duttonii]|uniref:hypothetical protein n=1 Tax=Borrelia duttonii TaxID=40834 RepID=UPI0002DCAF6C
MDNKGGIPNDFLKEVVNSFQSDEPRKEYVVSKVFVKKVVRGDSVIKHEKEELILALIN